MVLHEADEHEGLPYMVLGYLEGQSLTQVLKEARVRSPADPTRSLALPVPRAAELMMPVLRALVRAHEMGIVHRDLEPDNVMLTNAPEQLSGSAVDARTDLWAVGIMLYELLTGDHPLAPVSIQTLEQVARLDIPMPRVTDLRPDLGPLGAIVDRCLIKAVPDRMATARALLDELEPFLDQRSAIVQAAEECPFSGLAAFQEDDADRFFGRASDVARLVTRRRKQPLVAVVGPSGIGKSSVVRAGVIPALERSGEGWQSIIVRPGRKPLAAPAGILAHGTDRHDVGAHETAAWPRRSSDAW